MELVYGDIVAAARVILKKFPGELEKIALHKSLVIVQEMEARIRGAADLTR